MISIKHNMFLGCIYKSCLYIATFINVYRCRSKVVSLNDTYMSREGVIQVYKIGFFYR